MNNYHRRMQNTATTAEAIAVYTTLLFFCVGFWLAIGYGAYKLVYG